MTKQFYLDTSIWLDFYEKREQNGVYALQFIITCLQKKYVILYSDLIIKELKQLNYKKQQIEEIFSLVKPSHLKRVHIYNQQILEAKKLASQRKIPRNDALHAILSRDNDAQLITRDKDFQKLKDITKSELPELDI